MLTKLKYPTLSYSYDDEEEEFIFCVKGKPFPCLVSAKLPTPASTLIDYDMVSKLGLKMADLQCKRYSYAGYKMRVLGTVYTSVQCIQDGQMCGTVKLKADVVEDLAKYLDVQCVAGQRMAAQLRGNNTCTPSGALTPSRASPKPSLPPTPTPPSTPPPPKTPSSSPSSSPSPRRSPPGFPAAPQYNATPPRAHLLRKVRPISPWSANIKKLDEMFVKADLKMEGEAEFDTLTNHDDAGIISIDDKTGLLAFKASDGTNYIQGHGRYKCSRVRCQDDPGVTSVPDNCGYKPGLWTLPELFVPCGQNCRGAYCNCLHTYVLRL